MSGARRRLRLSRLSPIALVLTGAYIGLFALYAWQALDRATITIFSDEIEMAQMTRAIAETGEASLRAGAPTRGFPGLSAYLIAPWWWIDDVATAHDAIKLTGAAVMTAAIFPAYALGRFVLTPGWAAAAAIASVATPALAYAPFLVKEPFAYPAATTALVLAVRAVVQPTVARWALALAAATVGWLIRGQLAVLFFLLVAAAAYVAWESARARSWRSTWSRSDWVGAAVLALGGVVTANALLSANSLSWYTTTTFLKDRVFDHAVDATGAFAIGVGVLPLVAGVAALARPARSREQRALAVVTGAGVVSFVLYAGIKGAYLSTVYADLVVERNVIYLAPPLFAGTAAALSYRDTPAWATFAAGGLALYLVVNADYGLSTYPNYEAHGLAMAAFANRILEWPEPTIQTALVVVTLVAVVCLLVVRARAAGRLAAPFAGALAVLALAWTLTAEIYAAHGENLFAERELSALPSPPNWLDRTIAPESAIFLGQRIGNANAINQLEFWNRSLKELWSLDQSAPGPGRTTTPDLGSPDGTLHTPVAYGERYVVAGPGVNLAGRPLGDPVGEYRLYPTQPDGTIRLASAQTGIFPDGWMSGLASFSRHDVAPGTRELARVVLSREAWCGIDVPGKITIKLGPIAVNEHRQPYLREVTARGEGTVHSCERKVFVLRTPPEPWRVEVRISPTFSPRELDATLGESRQLGARVEFGTVTLAGP